VIKEFFGVYIDDVEAKEKIRDFFQEKLNEEIFI